jgi:hypothetical protein
MPYYCILFYSILFYSILFYSILFYSILFYSILFYYIQFYSFLLYSILFYSISRLDTLTPLSHNTPQSHTSVHLAKPSVADPGCLTRIPDPDFSHPRSRIANLGYRNTKEEGKKNNLVVLHFFKAIHYTR